MAFPRWHAGNCDRAVFRRKVNITTNSARLCRQIIEVLTLLSLSLALGLVINEFRGRPLALSYRTPEQRLTAQLAELVKQPPFEIQDSQTIGLARFRQAFAEHDTLILDARAAPFYRLGHVPGALNLSRENFARDYQRLAATLTTAKDRPIVVYCSGGSCHDSKMVAGALLSLGFADVRVFTGGWDEWKDAGLPASH